MDYNRYSKVITKKGSQPAAQAMLHAIGLTKKDFNELADDFDKRVQKTRNLYDLKDSQLRGSLEKWKKNFIELSGRIIQPIMLNYRAFIVLDSSQIDLFFDNRIDITEQVVLELDELYKSDPKYLEVILGK